MVEAAFRANELALPALKNSPAVHTVLPVVVLSGGAHIRINRLAFQMFVSVRVLIGFYILWSHSSIPSKSHQANRSNPIPNAFTAPLMLKGSFSVVVAGTSSDE